MAFDRRTHVANESSASRARRVPMTDLREALEKLIASVPGENETGWMTFNIAAQQFIRDHGAALLAALDERDALLKHNRQLTGETFSERNHAALQSRANEAERERDALAAQLPD